MSIGTEWDAVDLAATEWMLSGLCAQTAWADMWHPEKNVGKNSSAQAKAVCRTCPVARQCLLWALERCETGIWGATSDKERQLLRARMRGERAA